MNIAVIKLKDLIKYVFCFIIILAIVSVGIINIKRKEELEKEHDWIGSKIKDSSFLCVLKIELPLISSKEKKEEKENTREIGAEKIFGTQLALMDNLEDEEIEELEHMISEVPEEDEKTEENSEEQNNKDGKGEETEGSGDIKTEVINNNNIKASYTDDVNSVKVNNQTSYDIKDIIANPSYDIKNKEKFIIYHTHTCESYTSSDSYKYEMTGTYRTTDLNYTVSRVGDELEKYLKENGKKVVHDKTYHDYPSYNGSYNRSLKTFNNILGKNKDAEIAIDLHRDAVGSSNTYGPTVKIGEEVCAQVMFVIGTDGSRIISSKLEEKFAICNKSATNCK